MKLLPLLCGALLLAACGSKSNEAAEPTPAGDPTATTTTGDPTATTTTGDPAGPPAPNGYAPADGSGEVNPEWKAMGDLAVELMRKLHGVATTNASDCDAMGTGLEGLVAENQAFNARAKAFENSEAFNKWFAETYQAELTNLLQELQPALMGCQDNQKVKEAFQKFRS